MNWVNAITHFNQERQENDNCTKNFNTIFGLGLGQGAKARALKMATKQTQQHQHHQQQQQHHHQQQQQHGSGCALLCEKWDWVGIATGAS